MIFDYNVSFWESMTQSLTMIQQQFFQQKAAIVNFYYYFNQPFALLYFQSAYVQFRCFPASAFLSLSHSLGLYVWYSSGDLSTVFLSRCLTVRKPTRTDLEDQEVDQGIGIC
jgi:hypothetical protein